MNDFDRSVVVGISGPTCSGKSTLAEAMNEYAPDNVLVISQDDYYRDFSGMSRSEIARLNFDRPDAVDMPLLARQVRGLRMGFPVRKPSYCRQRHGRTSWQLVRPRPIVVVEGIFVLTWPDIVLELDLKVYLDADHDTIWKRRLRRDAACGQTHSEVSGRFDEMTWPGHLRHVEPSKELADLVVNNPFDTEAFATDLYGQACDIQQKLIPYAVMAAEKDV
jgi:uridine kinase